jgi:hypothetical protein
MSNTTEFTIGGEVACSDGVCGNLRRVVINPVARVLTHLIVEPRHRPGAGHLVPIDLVDSTTKDIQLRCTTSEFGALDYAQETQFLPGADGEWSYRTGPRPGNRSPRSSRDTRPPRRGPPPGPQEGRYSDQRRDQHRRRRPAQPHQGRGAGPATGRPRPPRMIGLAILMRVQSPSCSNDRP